MKCVRGGYITQVFLITQYNSQKKMLILILKNEFADWALCHCLGQHWLGETHRDTAILCVCVCVCTSCVWMSSSDILFPKQALSLHKRVTCCFSRSPVMNYSCAQGGTLHVYNHVLHENNISQFRWCHPHATVTIGGTGCNHRMVAGNKSVMCDVCMWIYIYI